MKGLGRLIIQIVFLGIFAIELFYFYQWVIEPLIPVISELFNTKFDVDISHPLNGITIGGMTITGISYLIISIGVRVLVFSLIFGLTGKIRSALLKTT